MNGIIILAAGPSSRLGKPKQLLAYRNRSLLRHVTEEAINSETGPVIVVVGANPTAVAAELKGADTLITVNAGWSEGMAASIRHGLEEILKILPDLDTVILAVCDQPFVNAALFRQLLAQATATGKGIVASAYEGTQGTPVLFDKKYFTLLLGLRGQQGAKKLLTLHPEDVAGIPFTNGQIDIDTPEDYQSLPQ
jgi:molybdenum cofactor cytidylyltransferase